MTAGSRALRLAFAIQFFIPGIPSIYYGDEYGMNGLMDPFNRGPYFKHDTKIYEELKTVSVFRSREKSFRQDTRCISAHQKMFWLSFALPLGIKIYSENRADRGPIFCL